MGLLSGWRHHLENEANRRLIAALPSAKRANRAERAEAGAARPARSVKQPKASPEQSRQASMQMWRDRLASAERSGNVQAAATYQLCLSRLEANTPEVRQAAAAEKYRAAAAGMANPKAARKMAARSERIARMTLAEWDAEEAREIESVANATKPA